VMTFINYNCPEPVLHFREIILATQALKQADCNLIANFLLCPGILTNVCLGYAEKCLNSFNPLSVFDGQGSELVVSFWQQVQAR
jgi:hypothetical protein